jgi:hypothetical protein
MHPLFCHSALGSALPRSSPASAAERQNTQHLCAGPSAARPWHPPAAPAYAQVLRPGLGLEDGEDLGAFVIQDSTNRASCGFRPPSSAIAPSMRSQLSVSWRL